MKAYDSPKQESDGIEIESRTERALTEPLSVVTLDGTPVEAGESVVQVVSHSGDSYHVDVARGVCECPDHRHREAECKHIRRARIALGETTISADVLAAVDVDRQLGVNSPGPRVLCSDGGIIEADDGGEILDETESEADESSSERPDDCECQHFDSGVTDLPCWACYRDGFETVADEAGRPTPTRSEPADFGGGETTGVQDL